MRAELDRIEEDALDLAGAHFEKSGKRQHRTAHLIVLRIDPQLQHEHVVWRSIPRLDDADAGFVVI